jgi:hypothetical protein
VDKPPTNLLTKIPPPEEINARLVALAREEQHLRALLRISVKVHHDDAPRHGAEREVANAR